MERITKFVLESSVKSGPSAGEWVTEDEFDTEQAARDHMAYLTRGCDWLSLRIRKEETESEVIATNGK